MLSDSRATSVAPLQGRRENDSYNGVPLGAHYLDATIQVGPQGKIRIKKVAELICTVTINASL